MTLINFLELFIFLSVLLPLSSLFGSYIYKVFDNKKTIFSFIFQPIEKFLYKICKIENDEYSSKKYLKNIFIFSFISFVFTFLVIELQEFLPLNPQNLKRPSLDLTFNITISFLTNTNWQSYVPETTLSYFSQMVGLTLQNFISPAIGFSVALVLIRGIKNNASAFVGNFYKDIIKFVLYVLLPICVFTAIIFLFLGVPQNFNDYKTVTTLEGYDQIIIGGPIASQEAIKIIGTNGGGFTLANSSHPFENPNFITNFMQMFLILLIPASQFFYFAKYTKEKKHAHAIIITMLIFFIFSFFFCFYFDTSQTPAYKNNKIYHKMGNFEGKETRFQEFNSTLFTTATTTASNGATNCNLDSLEPTSGLMPMLNIMLGEIIFGGIGSGLYSMIIFVLLAIFICGLVIGRTPEYFGKKIEVSEMKYLLFYILIFFFMILFFSSMACIYKEGLSSISNKGPRGLSEILYTFSSSVGNNGSSFSGLSSNTVFYNISTAICMLVGRYQIIVFIIILANIFAKKKLVQAHASFPLSGIIFVSILSITILLIGIMTFFPAVILGPILEKFYLMQGRFF